MQYERSRACARIAIVVVAWAGIGHVATAEGPRSSADSSTAIQQLSRLGEPEGPNALCGGEPCDAVIRGLLHFFDRSPEGLDSNGRSCGDWVLLISRCGHAASYGVRPPWRRLSHGERGC